MPALAVGTQAAGAAFAGGLVKQPRAGALLRSVGSAHYRYDFPTQTWVVMAAPPPGANTGRATAGPDALLQAPRQEVQ